jgi:hypothetical protein
LVISAGWWDRVYDPVFKSVKQQDRIAIVTIHDGSNRQSSLEPSRIFLLA